MMCTRQVLEGGILQGHVEMEIEEATDLRGLQCNSLKMMFVTKRQQYFLGHMV